MTPNCCQIHASHMEGYVPGGGLPAEGRRLGRLTASSKITEPTPVLFHFRASAMIVKSAKGVNNWRNMMNVHQSIGVDSEAFKKIRWHENTELREKWTAIHILKIPRWSRILIVDSSLKAVSTM